MTYKEKNPFYDFYYKKDRLNQLRGFCTTVQCNNSATQASKKLNKEPGTICKQINSLEAEFQIQLFDRTSNNRYILTPDGKKLYSRAIQVVQGADSIYQEFSKDMEEERKNNLRIAGIDVMLEKLISPLGKFKEENEKANVTLLNISKEKAFEKLKNNEIDIAFYPSETDEEYPIEMERTKISDYPSYWVMYKGHPLENKNESKITRKEYASYPFGYLAEIVYIKSFEKFIEEYNLKCPISLIEGTTSMLKELVRAKLCTTILDDFYLTKEDRKEFVLKNTLGCFPEEFYYSYKLKNVNHKEIVNSFLEFVKLNERKIFH